MTDKSVGRWGGINEFSRSGNGFDPSFSKTNKVRTVGVCKVTEVSKVVMVE